MTKLNFVKEMGDLQMCLIKSSKRFLIAVSMLSLSLGACFPWQLPKSEMTIQIKIMAVIITIVVVSIGGTFGWALCNCFLPGGPDDPQNIPYDKW